MDYDIERDDFVVSWYIVGELSNIPDEDESNIEYDQGEAEQKARELATLDCPPIGIWQLTNYDNEPTLIAIAFEGKIFIEG